MARHNLILVITTIFLLMGHAAAAAPRVVVSIKPLHSLVAGVMAGVAVPDLLVAGGASPHTYSLKPSDAGRLNRAQVIFWIGPSLENFLEKPLTTLAASAKVTALLDAPGVIKIAARNGGLWEETSDPGEFGDADGHIWLDPMNAKAMVAAIAQTLSAADPVNNGRYSANAALLVARLDALNAEIENMVAPVRGKPFVVFHDAYQYFQARYHVNAIGAITVNPDRMPGARRVAAIKEKIATLGAACVFAEPEFEPKLVRTLVEGTQVKAGVLDPEGTALDAGPELYFALMRKLADNLAGCLGA